MGLNLHSQLYYFVISIDDLIFQKYISDFTESPLWETRECYWNQDENLRSFRYEIDYVYNYI